MIRLRKNYQQNLCGCGQGRPFVNLFYRIQFRFRLLIVSFLSLFYNDHLSRSYVFDTLMEPAFWFVDSFAKVLGPLFVVGVVVLKTSVVAIAYIVGLPYYWEHKVCANKFWWDFEEWLYTSTSLSGPEVPAQKEIFRDIPGAIARCKCTFSLIFLLQIFIFDTRSYLLFISESQFLLSWSCKLSTEWLPSCRSVF